MKNPYVPRVVWPPDFPKVVIHAPLVARDSHPEYVKAKAGDRFAALALVRDLISADAVTELRQTIGHSHPILAAVTAEEKTGFNAIPDAMAHILGGRLGLPVDGGELVQTNIVLHTRASGWHRLVTPPTFEGKVEAGRDYVLIDDHIGLGGTLANLRGYIEENGGKVIAMTTLTQSRDANRIALTQETLNMLRSKHGKELENYWQEIFGYGLDCLTEVEGGYLARQLSFDAIAASMAKAAEEASSGDVSAIALPDVN